MSGVELAGLVLGAFPLLISALEHYRNLADAAGIFWKIKREHRKWMHDLKICHLAFERNLQFLLLPLVADDEAIDKLLTDPGGPVWRDPELEKNLEERLLNSYDLYRTSIEFIGETIEDIKEELGLNDAEFRARVSSGPSNPQMKLWSNVSDIKKNVSVLIRRFRLSLNESKRERLFKDLTKGNEQLRTLLDSSDRIATLQKSRGVTKKVADMKGMRHFWRQTDKLYGLLNRSWDCQCRELHSASLLLQHRTAATTDFQLFLFSGTGEQGNPENVFWTGQEAKIRVLEDQSSIKRTSKSRVSFTSSTTTIAAAAGPQIAITQISASTHRVGQEAADSYDKTMTRIISLCEEIPRFRSKDSQAQPFLLGDDHCSISLQPLQRPAKSPDPTISKDMISLETLLRRGSSRRLTRQARYLIGLTLASSYLQLKSSPWISHSWDKRDILFFKKESAMCDVQVEQPYISRGFEKGTSPGDENNEDNDDGGIITRPGRLELDDRTLKSLGIMLLELCFDTALEEYGPRMEYMRQTPRTEETKQTTADLFLDVAAAFEWSEHVAAEAGPEFSDAVTWCLTTTPNSSGQGRQPDTWRDELFEKVVQPLKHCCDQFTHRTRAPITA